MHNRDLTPDEKVTLEKLVDAANLEAVLQALSEICGEKAEHISSQNDRDPDIRAWEKASGIIAIASCDIPAALCGRG